MIDQQKRHIIPQNSFSTKEKNVKSKLTVNESEEAATLAAREERTFDSEVEVSADRDSLAATDVARALLGNILCVSNRSALKISAEVSADLDLSLMSPDSVSQI